MAIAKLFQTQIFLALLANASAVQALNLGSSIEGGLLQQPTSQYFHAGYGVSLWAASQSQQFGLRAIWFERPKFRSNGYEDQDSGGTAILYGSVWHKSRTRLLAGVGAGRFSGFISPQIQQSEVTTRTYSIPGGVVWAQLLQDYRGFQIGLSHWTLAGYAGRDQFDALVVWPFSVFSLSLGWSV